MLKEFEIAGYDMPCVDLAVNVDVFPKPNGGTGINAMSWQGGGKVATGMVAAARLGAKCAMIGAVVLSDRETQGRSIVYRSGTANPPTLEEIEERILTGCQWFFISHATHVAMESAKRAKKAGAKIIVDADSYSSEMMENIGIIDVFIASEFFYKVLFRGKEEAFEANCREVQKMGPSIVVFTLGAKGCVGYSEEDGFFQMPSFAVDVQDTVGAGDVFHGAYTVGLLRGLSPKEAARLATGVSCIKCTRIGGRAGIPDWNTVQRFLRTGEIDYTEIDQRVEFYRRKLQI